MINTLLDIKKIADIKPSERQLKWHELEFYAFIHFGINTFADREWGKGDESPSLFNPSELNAEQWVDACKSAGMKGLILTCKHHDGFCLWPSKYTEHSVVNSPWKNGNGDVVMETSKACKKAGLKFGIYLSPWDMHEKSYGDCEKYDQFFVNQLTELLKNYGEIFCVWFDGACGEGPNGKVQIYNWNRYYSVIRELQPNAVISVCGPDVRWCGNEAGHCRKSEWSVVPKVLKDCEKIAEKSQSAEDIKFSRRFANTDEDLGSRIAIRHEKDLIWYPAEVDTSIRPGWFYHKNQDDKVRSLTELLKIYYNSVGGNASLLLNIPPDKRGLFHENDVKRLQELGTALSMDFKNNLAIYSNFYASETLDDIHDIKNVINEDNYTFWCPKPETEKAVIDIDLMEQQTFNKIMLKEHIQIGQRIEEFVIEFQNKGNWEVFYKGTVVGYKKICRFSPVTARLLRISINKSRWFPTLSFMGIYTV